jgi:hypothetical protein|tara:strand:+ start:721 stop:1299 length:579 start_codon:yes stop_codon:yes gene_type:complete
MPKHKQLRAQKTKGVRKQGANDDLRQRQVISKPSGEVFVVGDDLLTSKDIIAGIDFSYDPLLDYHCWVVDNDGNVVFDPDFNQYQYKRHIRMLKDICHREEYPIERQQEVWNYWKTVKSKEVHPLIRKALKQTPCGGHCQMNAGNFLKANRGKGYRIAIGFMGWEKEDGTVFWEYGWDESRPHGDDLLGYSA